MEKKRSVGVTIFGWAVIIFGLAKLNGANNLLQKYSTLLSLDIIIGIGIGIGCIFSGIYILKLRNWVRIPFLSIMGMNALAGLRIVWSIVTFALSELFPFPKEKEGILIFLIFWWLLEALLPLIICIFFFTRPKVKEQFR